MARKKVVVKNLASMQNFGSIDVLCSDKTGTLTSGHLSLNQHLDPLGTPCEQTFQYAYLNSMLQAGISNPVDDSLRQTSTNPLDVAILGHDHADIHEYRKAAEVPFDFERRLVSVIAEHNGERVLVSKGAPESLLTKCTAYEANGQTYPLDAAAKTSIEKTYQTCSQEGFRVLGVAHRRIDNQPKYDRNDEHDLVLSGFLTFIDPPLEDATSAIQALHRDGVRVKILTGDNAQVTKYICDRVGLHVGKIIEGDTLDRLTDAAVAHLAEHTAAFARVSPRKRTASFSRSNRASTPSAILAMG